MPILLEYFLAYHKKYIFIGINFSKTLILENVLVESSRSTNQLIFSFLAGYLFCFVMAELPSKNRKGMRVSKIFTLHYIILAVELHELVVIICTRTRNISLLCSNFDDPFAIAVCKRTTTRLGVGIAIYRRYGWLGCWSHTN